MRRTPGDPVLKTYDLEDGLVAKKGRARWMPPWWSRCVNYVVACVLVLAAVRGLLRSQFRLDTVSYVRVSSVLGLRSSTTPFEKKKRVSFVNASEASLLTHLIVVCGHAVTMSEDLSSVASSDAAWYLLDYQRERDLPQQFVSHVRRGVELAAADPRALLIFSGGQTRADAGPRSEAQSYFFVAEHFQWFGRPLAASHASTEEHARDSFENLLFSVCRFAEITNTYPRKITVVSFDFKQRRFEELHAHALRYPAERFAYEAMPTAPFARFDRGEAERGERLGALEPYAENPYGCGGSLGAKRASRDPFKRSVPYGPGCPALAPLLAHCGPELFDASKLPWTEL